MNQTLPDIGKFKVQIFRKKNVLGYLLSFSLKLMASRQAGLIFGTDHTLAGFLPPAQWDRGVMHKFDGKGVSGFFLKFLGNPFVRMKKISPVHLYRTNQFGKRIETEGVISYVLRNHKEFYEKGIKILIITNKNCHEKTPDPDFSPFSVNTYDGAGFNFISNIKVNSQIVGQFRSTNFIAAYIPDYGAIVFNTIDLALLSRTNGCFSHGIDLKKRLDILISAIESASLAYLGVAKGKPAVQVIWRKERELRKASERLKKKEEQLIAQKNYLRAVGAVTVEQLNMTPESIPNGVYAFMDMVGSSAVRQGFSPRDFFLVLNLCHEIAVENAIRFACRVDNFIGDAVFFQNVSVFDDLKQAAHTGLCERVMLMTCMLASVFNEIHLLKQGRHPMDRERRVATLIKNNGISIGFRAGLEYGTALIGPLGSRKRKIVTAIGKPVETASRLESCGIPDKIHVTDTLLEILDTAVVSKDTVIIRDIAMKDSVAQWLRTKDQIPFFDYYKTLFNLGNDVIQKRVNTSYKEFSKKVTYLIHCIPEAGDSQVCPGI